MSQGKEKERRRLSVIVAKGRFTGEGGLVVEVKESNFSSIKMKGEGPWGKHEKKRDQGPPSHRIRSLVLNIRQVQRRIVRG